MYKKEQKEDEICQICGGKIWKAQKVMLEGAKIIVCQSCAQHGKKLPMKTKTFHGKIKSKPSQEKSPPQYSTSNKLRKSFEDSIEIVSDFSTIIRKARTLNNLNQDQFAQKLNEKPSLLRRIESGKVVPTLNLARKIEKVYNITLLKKTSDIEVNMKKYLKKSSDTSLGDIAFIKKKK